MPIIDNKPKTNFLLIWAPFLPKRPHQKPKATKVGIWLAGPRLMLSNKIPKHNPEITPEASPFVRDQGRSHKTTQHGETPKRVSHDGLVNVKQIDNSARKNAINLVCIIKNQSNLIWTQSIASGAEIN